MPLIRFRASAVTVVMTLLGFALPNAHAVTYDLVTVGNAGNANDPATGSVYGGVAYDYQIGMYDVTIQQYTDFLNAVATTDTYSLYNATMTSNSNSAGIFQLGSPGSYTYAVMAPLGANPPGASSPENRPMTNVSWFNAARFANWMANGQPTGMQTGTTTENGAYYINGATSGNAVARNTTNPNTGLAPTFYIPLENEWYKAAYYSPMLNSGAGGYYTFATQSNALPGNVIGSGANQANYKNAAYSVTQSGTYDSGQNYLTDVGAFANSASFYGTFDQGGNVYQWNDLDGSAGSSRGLRGGYWGDNAINLTSFNSMTVTPTYETSSAGFRLVAPVPEPSTLVMGLAGIVCGGWGFFRRRKRPLRRASIAAT